MSAPPPQPIAPAAPSRLPAAAIVVAIGLLAPLLAVTTARGVFAWSLAAGAWVLAVATGALTVVRTERARRDAARDALARADAQRLESIGRLAGGIAHDVNNYLAAIRAHCELVARKEQPRETVARRMEAVVETVLKASALLERLLVVARRQVGQPERLQPAEVIDNLLVMLRGTLRSDLEVATDVDADLWPVWIDLGQLEQILANLVTNAADATPPPGGRIVVRGRNRVASAGGQPRSLETATASSGSPYRVTGGTGGDTVVLEVSDTGSGIAPELATQIFEPFFTTKRARGASGLGLATVKALVEEAGGRVEVESSPGQGATFRVLLPRAAAPAAIPPRAVDVGPAGEGSADGTAASLLLVDDNAELRGLAAGHLASRGYAVAEAGTMGAALALAAGRDFAAIVTDVRLPDGDGPALVAALRERAATADPPRPAPAALYMSGYTDRIALRGAGRGGPAHEAYFLKKPFSVEGLTRMVDELLRQ